MTFLFVFILATIAFLIANKLRFFQLDWKASGKNPVRFWHVFLGYFIYLTLSIFLPLLFYLLVKPKGSLTLFSGISFLVVVAISIVGLWFLLSIMKKEAKRKVFGESNSIGQWKSFGYGALSYLVAFPTAALVSAIIAFLITMVYPDYQPQDQMAIYHLKMLAQYPVVLALTVLCFSVIVPIIEEFLFRGLLQSWLKNYLSRLFSVILTAVIFGFFHFSKAQGLANIDLIITLSVLGFFLGFVYEKRNSLWAPVGLHVAFNSISVGRILFEIYY